MDKAFAIPKMYSVFSPMESNITGQRSVSQPFPIFQPTTHHALLFALTVSGKILAGESYGTVNHVTPKTDVKMKTKLAAAAP